MKLPMLLKRERRQTHCDLCCAISKSRGTASLGSSFPNKESRSLLVDLINVCPTKKFNVLHGCDRWNTQKFRCVTNCRTCDTYFVPCCSWWGQMLWLGTVLLLHQPWLPTGPQSHSLCTPHPPFAASTPAHQYGESRLLKSYIETLNKNCFSTQLSAENQN
jgi:hypothetical protein